MIEYDLTNSNINNIYLQYVNVIYIIITVNYTFSVYYRLQYILFTAFILTKYGWENQQSHRCTMYHDYRNCIESRELEKENLGNYKTTSSLPHSAMNRKIIFLTFSI